MTHQFPHTGRLGLITLTMVLWMFPFLSGCAIKTPYLNINQRPISERAPYYNEPLPYRLLVLPAVDHRPSNEQQGQRPSAMFLLLWNKRVGDYYTGDAVFGNHVADQLSTQLADYLQKAHVFTMTNFTASLPPDFDPVNPAHIQQLARQHSADFVLRSELAHFFGSQHQQFSMYVLPLYVASAFGWQNNKSLPWGQTTLRVMLYDGQTGDIAWRQEFTAQETLPRNTDSMAEAAILSLSMASSQLTSELRRLPLQSMEPKHE